MTKDSLSNLNAAQRKAVEHNGGHLLIVAGPGTGKTHTLTQRILRTRQNADASDILAITFTNKAANELRQRLFAQSENLDNVFVGTFHSFCLKLLREFIEHTNLSRDFRIASPEDVAALAKNLWPEKTQRQRNDCLERISRLKSQTQNKEDFPEFISFNELLRRQSLIDFDDILQETYQLLKTNEAITKQLRREYRSIFVDEYQDINALQHGLLKILVDEDVELTAIGDPNQAIYGFRGSDVGFFESFTRDFMPALKLELSENYRSTQNLLTASSQVIEKGNSFSVPEITAKIYSQGRLTIHQAHSEKAEAEYVVHQVEKMVGGTSLFSKDSGRVTDFTMTPRSFGDVAILYRLNAQKHELKKAFERSGIPYQVAGEEKNRNNPDENLSQEQRDERALNQYEEAVAYNAEKVSLMTLHASKGLEFAVVFIVGCEETILPLALEEMKGDPEEERRLFYVGMTRAKESLYLLHARKRQLFGKTRENQASPFLFDIEEKLKDYEFAEAKKHNTNPAHEKQFDLFSL